MNEKRMFQVNNYRFERRKGDNYRITNLAETDKRKKRTYMITRAEAEELYNDLMYQRQNKTKNPVRKNKVADTENILNALKNLQDYVLRNTKNIQKMLQA